MTPRRLYDMLAVVRHVSWASGGGYARWSRARFTSVSDGLLLAEEEGAFVR